MAFATLSSQYFYYEVRIIVSYPAYTVLNLKNIKDHIKSSQKFFKNYK